MKIGINIDGVLINKTKFQYEYGIKYFGKNLRYVNESSYAFKNMFNCNYEIEEDFWNKHRSKYYLNTKIEDGAFKCLKELSEKGHEIYLIVDRKYLCDNSFKGNYYRFLLNIWLRHNKVIYDGIIYCHKENSLEEKMNVCMENQFDYMIEDCIPDSIILSKLCNVLMYNRPYNIGFSYVKRVNSFDEISKEICGKEKVKK